MARRQEGRTGWEGSDVEERHSDVIKVAELKGCTLPPPPLPEPAHVEGLWVFYKTQRRSTVRGADTSGRVSQNLKSHLILNVNNRWMCGSDSSFIYCGSTLLKGLTFPSKEPWSSLMLKKKINLIKSLKNFRSKVLKRGSNRQRTVHSFLIQLWQKTHWKGLI